MSSEPFKLRTNSVSQSIGPVLPSFRSFAGQLNARSRPSALPPPRPSRRVAKYLLFSGRVNKTEEKRERERERRQAGKNDRSAQLSSVYGALKKP